MFAENINSCGLCNDRVNPCFPHIKYQNLFAGDVSFPATLRALLTPRMSEGDDITFTVVSVNVREADQYKDSVTRFLFDRNPLEENMFALVSVVGLAEARNALIDAAASRFVSENPGFIDSDSTGVDFSATMKKSGMNCRLFTRSDTKQSVLICDGLNLARYHLLQVAIPRSLPWYFDGRRCEGVERELMESLFKRDADKYKETIEEIAGTMRIRERLIREALTRFEVKSKEIRIRAAKSELDDIMSSIESINARYDDLMRRREEANIRYLGLRQSSEGLGDNAELADLFIRNKNLEVARADAEEGRFDVIVRGYLDVYDPDAFETMAKHDDSLLFTDYDRRPSVKFKSVADRRLLLSAIFSAEPTLKIRTVGIFSLKIGRGADAPRRYDFGSAYADAFPNPHLRHYGCLGGHQRYINDRLAEGDLCGAVLQCLAAVNCINLQEAPTMEHFLGDLFNTEDPVIELPDGSNVSPINALKWLKENQK